MSIDGLPSRTAENIPNLQATPQFNRFFEDGIFLDALKLPIVVPVFETGEKDILGNHKPIDLLYTIAKTLKNA